MLDPTNPDPEKSKGIVDKIQLTGDRLSAALPILADRYSAAKRRELFETVKLRYNAVVEKHNECSDALGILYRDFVEQVIPMLQAAIQLNHEIRQMNAEVKQFDEFKMIPLLAERLIEKLVLPSSTGTYWPDERDANAFAVAFANIAAQTYASPLRQAAASPDWWEATRIAQEAKIADWERRNALQEERQLKARCGFEQSKIKQGAR
jgi:hypothetical protein